MIAIDPMCGRRKRCSWLVGVFLVVACGGANRALLDRVETTRAEVRSEPGARQSVAFAEAVHRAHLAEAFKSEPATLTANAEEAMKALEAAEPGSGADAPTVVAWRGLMLTDLGRSEEAWREFERSMSLGPNKTAATVMVTVLSHAGKAEEVGRICGLTEPKITETDERYSFIALCKEKMNALSDEVALGWATPEARAFYAEEGKRRESERQAAVQAEAEREAFEQRVVRQMEVCAGRCKMRGHQCLNRCGADQVCRDNCVEANHACVGVCESEARGAIGR